MNPGASGLSRKSRPNPFNRFPAAMSQLIAALLFVTAVGTGASPAAYVRSANQQSSHRSESSHSSSSSHSGGRAYSYTSQSARGPGYSYSYSYTNEGYPEYASGYHIYTPLFLSNLDLDLDLDLEFDPELDFYIDTDLDLDDIDLEFPLIQYGLGYIGKYGHWIRKPRYGFSRLYHNIDLDLLSYGVGYGYDNLDFSEPFGFGSQISFFK